MVGGEGGGHVPKAVESILSNVGGWDRDRAAQKAPEKMTDRQTDAQTHRRTNLPLYDDSYYYYFLPPVVKIPGVKNKS